MLNDSYPLVAGEDFMSYEFDSVGPKGIIRKIVKYDKIPSTDYYNLGFGDKHQNTEGYDDLIVTNNGDGGKVLATVAQTVFDLTRIYPDILVVAAGSTNARTRLYRILITNNLSLIEQYFDVFGLLNDVWNPFETDTDYLAFLIKRKTYNFKL